MLVLCHMVKRCWGTDGSMQTRLTVMRTVWIFNTYKWREKNGMWILSCKTSYRAGHNITSCSINVQLTSTTVMFLFWQTSATSKHFQRRCRHITTNESDRMQTAVDNYYNVLQNNHKKIRQQMMPACLHKFSTHDRQMQTLLFEVQAQAEQAHQHHTISKFEIYIYIYDELIELFCGTSVSMLYSFHNTWQFLYWYTVSIWPHTTRILMLLLCNSILKPPEKQHKKQNII